MSKLDQDGSENLTDAVETSALTTKMYVTSAAASSAVSTNDIGILETRRDVRLFVLIFTNMISLIILVYSIVWFFTIVRHRNHRFIKMSSASLNLVVCVGSTFASVAVILRSFDNYLITRYHDIWSQNSGAIAKLKHASILAISVAYTLVVLTSSLKALRIYILFSRPIRNLLGIKTSSLMAYTAFAVVIDVVICCVWYLIDPIGCRELTILVRGAGEAKEGMKLVCSSAYWSCWVGLLYALKVAALVMLIVFSSKIRGVTLEPLNDSKQNMMVAGVFACAGLVHLPHLLSSSDVGIIYSDSVVLTTQSVTVFICQLAAIIGSVASKFRQLKSAGSVKTRQSVMRNNLSASNQIQTPLADSMMRVSDKNGAGCLFTRFCCAFCPSTLADPSSSGTNENASRLAQGNANAESGESDRGMLVEEINNLKCALREKEETVKSLTSNLLYDSEAFKLYLEKYHKRFYSALQEVNFFEQPDEPEDQHQTIWQSQEPEPYDDCFYRSNFHHDGDGRHDRESYMCSYAHEFYNSQTEHVRECRCSDCEDDYYDHASHLPSVRLSQADAACLQTCSQDSAFFDAYAHVHRHGHGHGHGRRPSQSQATVGENRTSGRHRSKNSLRWPSAYNKWSSTPRADDKTSVTAHARPSLSWRLTQV